MHCAAVTTVSPLRVRHTKRGRRGICRGGRAQWVTFWGRSRRFRPWSSPSRSSWWRSTGCWCSWGAPTSMARAVGITGTGTGPRTRLGTATRTDVAGGTGTAGGTLATGAAEGAGPRRSADHRGGVAGGRLRLVRRAQRPGRARQRTRGSPAAGRPGRRVGGSAGAGVAPAAADAGPRPAAVAPGLRRSRLRDPHRTGRPRLRAGRGPCGRRFLRRRTGPAEPR